MKTYVVIADEQWTGPHEPNRKHFKVMARSEEEAVEKVKKKLNWTKMEVNLIEDNVYNFVDGWVVTILYVNELEEIQ